jgi:DNA-binding LacI/PurR family transcriptional regulator
LPCIWHDEAAVVTDAIRYLAALGHARIAHVCGVAEFVHTQQRTTAFRAVVRELGIEGEVVETDYSAENGARATRRLLSSPTPPTAILFDSDLLAVTGLGVVQQMGFSVPDDLSIVGWDDSLISQVVHPPLTAITRDITTYGACCSSRSTGDEPAMWRRCAASSRRGAAPRVSRRSPPPASTLRCFDPRWSGLTLNRISDFLDSSRC